MAAATSVPLLIIFSIMVPMIRVRVAIRVIEDKASRRLAAARVDNPQVAVGTDNRRRRRIPVARASADLRAVQVDRPRLTVMVVMTISGGKAKKQKDKKIGAGFWNLSLIPQGGPALKLAGYKNCGGRGIKVCDRRLETYEHFLAENRVLGLEQH
jgi:hypothetical protein